MMLNDKIFLLILLHGLFAFSLQTSTPFMMNMLSKKINTECLESKNISLIKTGEKMQGCVDAVVRPVVQSILNGEDYLNLLIDQLCRKYDMFICLIRAKEEVEECLSEERKEYFLHMMKSFAAGLSFACQKNAYQFTEFYRKDGKKCFFRIQTGLNKCFKQRNKNAAHRIEFEEPFGRENCQNQEQFVNCFVAVMEEECEDKSGSHFFYGFFYTMLRATPCVDYVKSSARNVSFNGSVLMLILLFISTRIF